MTTVIIPEILKEIVPHIPKVSIPCIIHQTYISLEKLPKVWKDTPATWRHHHPTWEYRFWSDDDCRRLVKEQFPWFLTTYDRYEYNIQRADAIRPMILYFLGGLYGDLDIVPTRPLDDLFYKDSDLYLIRTPNTNTLTNCLMASKPGIKFWIRLIEEMKLRAENLNILSLGKHWTVMTTTGPMILSDIFSEHEKNLKVKFLPQSLVLPCNICTPKPCSTILGYTKLLDGSSWIEFDTTIYNFTLCHYPQLLILFAVAFFLYMVYTYYTTYSSQIFN